MYYSQWGLKETPFRAGNAVEAFFPSVTHEEALARLQFLVNHHHRCGLLVAERGMGKSLLLSVLADELRQKWADVASVNLTGVSASEFPLLLATQLTSAPLSKLSQQQAWQALANRFGENHCEKRATLIALDDADQAQPGVWDEVMRLIYSDRRTPTRLTVVCAIHPRATEKIPVGFHDMALLRIEIEPWQIEDTTAFLASRIAAAGGDQKLFDEQAIARIQETAAGNPQRIVQLADLSLLVAAGEGTAQIDPQLVSKAAEQLWLAGLHETRGEVEGWVPCS
ncbi:MAG: AAA family ATPase [Planctomycetales bacterium]|nr:AAA family ATPase [Planctomycetales bacterium]NIM07683.1 AAA family ATPase [Planctomycetales bacterium]NIN07186.1 AAA family ATPase [Planctomycetales bacterium]NIN76279.1 AAA family ATPase [Planctomycetales bacterium]NIO33485.1 AAA family ATPase [Planctomycetales bacterium]